MLYSLKIVTMTTLSGNSDSMGNFSSDKHKIVTIDYAFDNCSTTLRFVCWGEWKISEAWCHISILYQVPRLHIGQA